MSIAWLKSKGEYAMPSTGIHTVTVPGAVAGWSAMHQRYGKLPWRDLFQPAIYYARNGFPVTELIQWDWEQSEGKLRLDENARRVFLPGGHAPRVGEIFRNPELARALELIANGGPRAFYRGPVGDALLATSKRLGGAMSAEDLASFEPEWVDPISIDYRGWKVYQLRRTGRAWGRWRCSPFFASFPSPVRIPRGPTRSTGR